MGRSVAESWGLIVGWLEEHLPGALEHLHPAATGSEISALRTAMDRRLPSDLVAWLTLNNGFGWRADFGRLVPVLYIPMPTEGMLRDREMLREVYADWDKEGADRPAGSPAWGWLDAFLPIGDAGTDCHLFVDLREGEHHGCVGEFDNEDSGFVRPEWFSIGEMLADVADSLTLGRPALQDYGRRTYAAERFPTRPPRAWAPYLDGERLRWRLVEI